MADLLFQWTENNSGVITLKVEGSVGGTASDWKNYSRRQINILHPGPYISIGVLPIAHGFQSGNLTHNIAASEGAGKNAFRGWYVPTLASVDGQKRKSLRRNPTGATMNVSTGSVMFYLGTGPNAWEIGVNGTTYEDSLNNLINDSWNMTYTWSGTVMSNLNITSDRGIWVYNYGNNHTIRVEIRDDADGDPVVPIAPF